MGTSEYLFIRDCSFSSGMQYDSKGTITSDELAGFMEQKRTTPREKPVISSGIFILRLFSLISMGWFLHEILSTRLLVLQSQSMG